MSGKRRRGELGDFLKACRSRVQPEDIGLRTYGDRRRVTGLRREELALLAGVSSSYYTRLEQGQSHNASPQVLDALAAALQLNAAEAKHLHVLADSANRAPTTRRAPTEHADPALIELLGALGDVPAVILGRRSDVLAWNRLGHALLAGNVERELAGQPSRRPNMTELVFLDPHCRELYADWTAKARAVVGNLRLVAGQHPDDPALAALIGKLILGSPHFEALWADHRVKACAAARYELRHPLVGRLTITQQALRSIETPDQTLITCTAEVASASAEALTLLAQLLGETGNRQPFKSDGSAPLINGRLDGSR